MKITNLKVSKGNKEIIKGIDLTLEPGIHILMGPNGSGKTTLSYSIAGHPDCDVTDGEVMYKNKSLLEQSIQERSLNGVFLAPQYPSVIEGLSNAALLKEAINSKREYNKEDPLDEFDFLSILKKEASNFKFEPKDYIRNSLNFGFSGGEKKRNEILQISMLKPDFIILDEIDSGLDIEAMKYISSFINKYSKEKNATILAITHYPNFAKLLEAKSVILLKNGTVSKIGTLSLVDEIEANGFGD